MASIRMEGKVGEIVCGAAADLVVLDANPFDGLECFAQHDNKVVAVMQAGCVARDDTGLLCELA